jgi:alpha-amylase
MRKLFTFICASFLVIFLTCNLYAQQPANVYKKVVLQSFWWDYWNSNYPNSWANYMTELAPRLRQMGIDGVWIPGDVKQAGLNSVGYSPFDHYDLGDKLQRSIDNGQVSVKTRLGTKDELLRMVAVLHANGIEVYSDLILNHMDGAGAAMNGSSGQDNHWTSMISNDGYKNFRYACYETPINFTLPNYAATDDYNTNDYWSRKGRWPMNYPNFHLHAGHWDTNSDMALTAFGPDICYGWDGGNSGYGQSSNISGAGTYNPQQSPTHNWDNAVQWLKWYKKQTGVDGFRWDAVKHFPYELQSTLLWETMYNNVWNSGNNEQFNVGEYVGDIEWYSNHMRGLSQSNDLRIGALDFQLRAFSNGGLHGLVTGSGNHDIGALPGSQISQANRYQDYSNPFGGKRVHRSTNFVNSHDTFRPILDANGNYSNQWDNGHELYPGHIDPRDYRLSNAYAVCLAFDGNTSVYFEDLFDIGSNGNRYTHHPGNPAELPARGDLENMIWAHRNLDFKNGQYKVRWQDGDYLVVERSNRAFVGINDNWNTWRGQWVGTDLAPGTVLKDYSGANGTATQTVQPGSCLGGGGPNCVFINTPPVDPVLNPAGRKGYSIWAPVGQDNDNDPGYANPITTQEWEMANDLGDSHCSSLGYGGALPANSTRQRVVGKIYAAQGQTITYNLHPEVTGTDHNIALFDLAGNKLGSTFGVDDISSQLVAPYTGWYVIKIWNSFANTTAHKAWIKVSYVAPTSVNTTSTPVASTVSIWTGNSPADNRDWFDCRNWEEGKIPNATTDVIIPAHAVPFPEGTSGSITVRNLKIENGAQMPLSSGFTVYVKGDFVNLNIMESAIGGKVVLEGAVMQTITGPNNFNQLEINNSAGVTLASHTKVTNFIALNNGKVFLGNFNLTLADGCDIYNTNSSRYFVTTDNAANGGYLIRYVANNNNYVDFPVGTAEHLTNATVRQPASGLADNFKVRVFNGVLTKGNTGTAIANGIVNKTWDIRPETADTNAVADVVLVWNGLNQNNGFFNDNAYIARNNGNSDWYKITQPGWTNGSDPYSLTATGMRRFSYLMVASNSALAPCWELPGGWASQGVENPVTTGSVCYDLPSGSYTVKGAGTDIAGTSDQFHFVYKNLSGNGTIIANLTSIQNVSAAAKAGIMIRETLTGDSKNVFAYAMPGGKLAVQARSVIGGTTKKKALPTTELLPKYLKMTRTGNTFKAYYSANGSAWTLIKSFNVTMSSNVYIGLAVTSRKPNQLNTSVFDNVTISNQVLAPVLPEEVLINEQTNSLVEEESMHVFPNPNTGQFQVTVNTAVAGNTELQVVDMTGRIIWKLSGSLEKGLNNFQVSLNQVPAGIYWVQVRKDDRYWNEKVVVQ